MDVSAIASLATDLAQTRTLAEAQISVQKKAMELQGAGVLQLLEAAAQVMPQAPSNPPHLGNNVDVLA
ncbi:hypothetical protein DLREEDagrD3_17590 [Denitratisoma sp. agr-D3]